MSGDVLTEDQSRPCFGDDPANMGPQVSRIIFASSAAGAGERLARVARSDEIHDSAPRAAVEGSQIRPDRRRSQGLVFHARCQYRDCICLPLDMTDCAVSRNNELDAELETSNPGT
jgi:hypothetical protein